MAGRKKGFFAYNGKLQSITNILKEPGVSEFLQRNRPKKRAVEEQASTSIKSWRDYKGSG